MTSGTVSVYLNNWYGKITWFSPPFLSLSSLPLSGPVVSCQCPFCSEMLWGGGSDTWHRVKGEDQTIQLCLMHPWCFSFSFNFFCIWTLYLIHCISACIPVVVLALSSSCTWLCTLIFLDLTRSLSHLSFSLYLFLSFIFSLYATTKVPKQQFSMKIIVFLLSWSCTLPVTWAGGGLCLFLEGVNTGLSFSGGKPRSSCTFLTSL